MSIATRRQAAHTRPADIRTIADQAWHDFAQALDIEEAALRAVAEVESSGSGFLPPPSNKPKILFEGHAFHRLTGGRYSADHPNISYPKWSRRKYSGSLAGEWQRLEAACRLDRIAALQSASWGLFQIMGFNYPYCGCEDVETFVARQYEGATQQLATFVKFVSRPPYLPALRNRNWKAFARAYNGPGFATNRYDGKLAAAYARWSEPQTPAATPRTRKPPAPRNAASRGLPPGRETFAPISESVARIRAAATCVPIPSTCATGNTGQTSPSPRVTC